MAVVPRARPHGGVKDDEVVAHYAHAGEPSPGVIRTDQLVEGVGVATICILRTQNDLRRLCRACWSLLHAWIVRRVGVHGRAAVVDGFGAQFVVPGFIAVDLA